MNTFSSTFYPWLKTPFDALNQQQQSGKFPHAVLVCGPAYSGKQAFLKYLAQALLCQHSAALHSCEQCHSCLTFEAGAHPDFLAIQDQDRTIGVDEIRMISEKILTTSHFGGARIVVIPDIGRMTIAASNALLKSLEEPPGNTCFLLSMSDKANVLPTILSRCLRFELRLKTSETTAWFMQEGIFIEDALQRQFFSRMPRLAQQWSQSKQLSLFQSFNESFDGWLEGNINTEQIADFLLAQDDLNLYLNWLLFLAYHRQDVSQKELIHQQVYDFLSDYGRVLGQNMQLSVNNFLIKLKQSWKGEKCASDRAHL
ncbi:hypothetical protein [Algicola sagamiensis]|uniref:hypothetical protein n=1 Tax=Algicola sagamiensis TaxID=163869 RepID=UPI00037910C2|nr:hypothetical protein [Algicola sagamiensis]